MCGSISLKKVITMYLLDDRGNVHNIDESTIICIEVSRPHIYYRTIHKKYRSPRTLIELLRVYEALEFTQIDKKKIVSIPLADKIENANIQFGDLEYTISRNNISKVKKMMEQKKPN